VTVNYFWAEANWAELEAAPKPLVAVLPVGAVEAHGPHLPLATDNLISEAMALEGARRLAERGVEARVLPAVTYTAAPFASGFLGTVSVSPATVTALVVDIGRALAAQGVAMLAIANAHFDPANLESLYSAIETLRAEDSLPVVFPDLTRRPWALRLGDEFRSGSCHAGSYEGSVVMALAPELVDEEVRTSLPANLVSLSRAIADGSRSFEEIGGDQAYFGDPASASAAEGRETIAVLGDILAEAVEEARQVSGR
jgi:creatinine amidohydrolase